MIKLNLFFFTFLFITGFNSQTLDTLWVNKYTEFWEGASANTVTTDLNGDVIAAGSYGGGLDFNTGSGTAWMSATGDVDAFVTKVNAAGNFIWAKKFGGSSNNHYCRVYDVTTDASNNVYLTGTYTGTIDFNPGSGVFTLESLGYNNVFIAKLDANGNFLWAKKFGASQITSTSSTPYGPSGILIDSQGNICITGNFDGVADFDPGSNTFNLISAGEMDTYLVKLTSDGNFIWGKSFGGTLSDTAEEFCIDNSGNIFITGYFAGQADFDPDISVNSLDAQLGTDSYVVKFTSSGNFCWVKQFGNTIKLESYSIDLDANENIYITGSFYGTADFNPDAGTTNLTAITNFFSIYIVKLNADGTFVWAKSITGNENDMSKLVVDSNDDIYISGSFIGTADFDPGAGVVNVTVGATYHLFILKLDSNGNYIISDTYDTGTPNELASDALGNVLEAGHAVFNTSTAFVMKLNSSNCSQPNPPSSTTPSANLTVCTGSTTSLSAFGTGSIGWYTSETGDVVIGTGDTITTPVINSTVTYYAQSYTCSASSRTPITITTIPSPTVTATATPTSVCPGFPSVLTATGDAVSYSWSNGITNGSTASPLVTTIYYVTGLGANNCTKTIPVTVTCKPVPNIVAVAVNDSVCAGNQASLSVSGASGGSYLWSNMSTSSYYYPTISSDTAFTVVGTATNGCTNSDTIEIFVKQTPIVTASAIPDTICNGESVILDAETNNGTITWSFGVADGVPFTPQYSSYSNVTVVGTNGCSVVKTVFYVVNPLPNVSGYASPPDVCPGEATALIGSGADTYLWSDGVVDGVDFYPTVSDTYTVIGTDTNGCSDSFDVIVELLPAIDTSLSINGNTITANLNGAQYQWVMCELNNLPISGATSQSFTPSQSGIYAVVISESPCSAMSSCVTIDFAGTAELFHSTVLKLYPNPVKDNLTITSSEKMIGTLKLYDYSGKLVHQEQLTGFETEIQLDLSTFENGMYSVQLASEKYIVNEKITVFR